MASVAKSADGVVKAFERLSDSASKYSMLVLMSNWVGHSAIISKAQEELRFGIKRAY